MTASICFEQSYSGIDGDSASSTELYALLSALSGVPIRQDLAVTGSVDQYGTVQAIGGVNEKIEGFYRVCKAIGLTGTQGVMVPRTNVSNLMLDPETIGAIERGEFHIYPIDTIDRGIETLTGVRAGTIDEPGTINYLVDQRLKQMANILRDRPMGETRVVQEPAPNAARAQTARAAGASALAGSIALLRMRRRIRMPIDLRLDPAEVALFTDLYELTVGAAFFEHGFNETASFEVALRRMPPGRGFMIAAGIERLIEALEEYRFDAGAIEHLDSLQLFKPAFLEFLSTLRFTGSIRALPEGTIYFPGEPDCGNPRATDRGAADRDAGAQPARLRVDRRDQGGAMLRGRGRPAPGGLRPAARAGCRRGADRGALELPRGLSRHLQRARRQALRDSRFRHDESQLRDGA